MRTFLVSLAVLLSIANVPSAVASPEGQMNFALQVSLAPVWFDPAETTSTSVPFIVRVLRPVRGSQAQSEMTIADMIVGS
jgi:hypothetical protein